MDLGLFRMTLTDFQTLTAARSAETGLVQTLVANAGAARAQGVEVERTCDEAFVERAMLALSSTSCRRDTRRTELV
ncbi:MAG: hypothetical protein ACREQY_22215 [Candidatus Binatia bacterium]